MKITTIQVDAADALRAVADGKSVQMIWTNEGKPFFSNFTEKIMDAMAIGEAFLIVDIENDELTVADGTPVEEIAVPAEPKETIVTDPDNTPITVKIPNSHKAEREKKAKVDNEMILKLRKDGLTEMAIADELDVSMTTVHNHLAQMKKEGRL